MGYSLTPRGEIYDERDVMDMRFLRDRGSIRRDYGVDYIGSNSTVEIPRDIYDKWKTSGGSYAPPESSPNTILGVGERIAI